MSITKAKMILNNYLKTEQKIKQLTETIKPILDQIEALKKEQKNLKEEIIQIKNENLVPENYIVELKEIHVPAYSYTKVIVAKH